MLQEVSISVESFQHANPPKKLVVETWYIDSDIEGPGQSLAGSCDTYAAALAQLEKIWGRTETQAALLFPLLNRLHEPVFLENQSPYHRLPIEAVCRYLGRPVPEWVGLTVHWTDDYALFAVLES